MAAYLMAIDAGTGSVRSVLFDAAGRQIGAAAREWFHKEDPRFPGSMDFDWVANWALTVDTIREVLGQTGIRPEEVGAIATTCMREGIVLYDGEGREIWACANVDARSSAEVRQLKAMADGLELDVYKKSGQTFALGALPRLLWVKNHLPDLYAQTAHVSMFNDWLIYKLSGVLLSEPSNGCTTGIFDINSRAWDPAIARLCGLRTDIFPPVQESGTVTGKVSQGAAAQTGLAAGTLVVTGGGDAQLGAVGAGAIQDGQIAVFGGSFWQLECNTAAPRLLDDCRIRVNCHAVPGVWQYEAIAFFPGLIMRWYRDAFCQWEKEEGKAKNIDPYVLMDQKAADVPAGCGGMMAAFSDVMDYKNWRHAAPTFTNFSLDADRFNRFTFYRALMENAALVTKGHLLLAEELTGQKAQEIIFANGASKSGLWCQIMADVLGVRVRVPKVKETTALGAALCAGVGAGLYKTLAEGVAATIAWDQTYTPNAANHDLYNQLYENWRQMYAAQLGLADAGVTRYMWAAP